MSRKLQKLEESLVDWVAPEELDFYTTLCREMYGKAPASLFAELGEESLIAIATNAVNLLEAKKPHDIKVRVSNPRYSSDGWESCYTAVEVTMSDRPFLFDSVTHELKRLGLELQHALHPVFKLERDECFRLLREVKPKRAYMEAYELFLVSSVSDDRLVEIEQSVLGVLHDVRKATDDYLEMRRALGKVSAELVSLAQEPVGRTVALKLREGVDLLEWLDRDNFIFLAYQKFEKRDSPDGANLQVSSEPALGLASDRGGEMRDHAIPLSNPPDEMALRMASCPLVAVSKSDADSTVHRPGKMDRIVIKSLDRRLQVIGEHCFLGLFTSSALSTPVKEIPILRDRLQKVLELDGAVRGSHDFKQIVSIFNSTPREELFWSQPAQLHRDIRMIMAMQREDEVGMTVRPDPSNRGVLVMIVMPRDRYDSGVRYRVQELLLDVLNAKHADFRLSLGEDEERARLHFFVSSSIKLSSINLPMLESRIAQLTRTWRDSLTDRLVAERGSDEGRVLGAQFRRAFPEEYTAQTSPEMAIHDIDNLLQRAENGQAYRVAVYPPLEEAAQEASTIRIYHEQESLALSDVLPMLENLGLRVLRQSSHQVPFFLARQEHVATVDVLRVQDRWTKRPLELSRGCQHLISAIDALLDGKLQNQPLNGLIVSAGLSWRQVNLLGSYQAYLSQVSVASSRQFITQVMLSHPETSARLFGIFETKFRPGLEDREQAIDFAEGRFLESLEQVGSLAFDRTFRALFHLIRATVRTNFFLDKPYVSHKIRSAEVMEMPEPRPLFEIVVVGPGVEGIHLRGGMVARGGLRWSDRPDDFRTEVLGLMKTQMAKNAVIVPVGSKGGFVLKDAPCDREELGRYVVEQYKTFIRGLLDLTDSKQHGRIVHPDDVVRYDGPDPYLVVAADKGTAKFSDVANSVAAEYDFWLGDAFASGGSFGYDHKKEGITARGAWECVKRHFYELGIDVAEQEITCVGIGDMSGDVFGNGMLYTDKILLKAAFNHQHIFIDPSPDSAVSHGERKRLFELPRSGWDDYDRSLISPGGGVFSRAAKSIPLSREIQVMLGLEQAEINGHELVRAVLRMSVDLLWNGGIGTYVRAAQESDASVSDSSNDAVRIPASELWARVVGEGGNGGFTQLARIEYASGGGRINTDAIDNSAGVDMSDHEVNIKMLLQSLPAGEMTLEERNQALESMTTEVTRAVLKDNYWQSLCLSLSHRRSREDVSLLSSLTQELTIHGPLDPAIENLPDRKTLQARHRAGGGLTRPELAILLAYTKMHLYRQLLASDIPEDPLFAHYLEGYFPSLLRERYPDEIQEHPLRREIIATEMTNAVVNLLGITFVHRAIRDTGATPVQVLRAVLAAMEMTDMGALLASLTATKGRMPAVLFHEVLSRLTAALESVTSWILLADADLCSLRGQIVGYRQHLQELQPRLGEIVPAGHGQRLNAWRERLEQAGLEAELTERVIALDYLTSSLCIVEGARLTGDPLPKLARRYYEVGERLRMSWLRERLREIRIEDKWSSIALAGLVMDLRQIQLKLSLVEVDLDTLPGNPLARYLQLLTEVTNEEALDQSSGDVLARLLGQVAETAHRQARLNREREQHRPVHQPRHSQPHLVGAERHAVNW